MKCDRCQLAPASVRISQTVNGVSSELHLCRECAVELENEYAKNAWGKLFPDTFFGSWLGHTGGIPSFGEEVSAQEDISCPTCGCSFKDFRRTGLFGCADCYQAFRGQLDEIFRRVQAGSEHMGRIPGSLQAKGDAAPSVNEAAAPDPTAAETAPTVTVPEPGSVADLRRQQQEAVEREDYELAARLRDQIREVEGGQA